MEEIRNLLEARKNYLLQLKKEKEKELENVPEGSLRICSHGNRTQYYRRHDPKDFNGVYIPEENVELAKELAQKNYNQKVCCSVEKELNAIKRYLSSIPLVSVEFIYEKLNKERQKLIYPIVESEKEYVHNWERMIYQGKGFDEDTPEIYTDRGERVRSKSEVIIADALVREAIPYRYEYPIYLNGVGKVYPDFTVLNVKKRKEIYWEHFGMMDDLDYVEKAVKKITSYEENGIFPGENLIITYETRKNPINQKIVKLLIQQYLKIC